MTQPTDLNLDHRARELSEAARSAPSGRASHMLFGGPGSQMTQTVIALRAGAALHEHGSPSEATLIVLQGEVRLTGVDDDRVGRRGDVLVIPPERHGLEALTDAAVLLTAVKRNPVVHAG